MSSLRSVVGGAQATLRAPTHHISRNNTRGVLQRISVYNPESLPSAADPYVTGSYAQDPYVSEPAGARVEQWLKTPFDIAAFGPRAAAGALASLPERMANLQADVLKVVELIQDPRPMDEKQNVLLKEAEDTVLQFLERGVVIEADVFANLKTVLPPDAAEYLNDLVPEPPNAVPRSSTVVVEPVTTVSASGTGNSVSVTYSQSDVLANQLASEMTEIKAAVTGLKNALDDVRTNMDTTRTNMLRLNLREARDLLARRLAEISPATAAEASISAAAREANILLEEVDAQFFS